MDHKVLVCQNTTCTKQGAKKVLKAFEKTVPEGTEVEASGCLGQCGSGPTVLMVPEKTWCLHVQPHLVPGLVKQHLENETAEAEAQSTGREGWLIWALVLCLGGAIAALIIWVVAQQSYYI